MEKFLRQKGKVKNEFAIVGHIARYESKTSSQDTNEATPIQPYKLVKRPESKLKYTANPVTKHIFSTK